MTDWVYDWRLKLLIQCQNRLAKQVYVKSWAKSIVSLNTKNCATIAAG